MLQDTSKGRDPADDSARRRELFHYFLPETLQPNASQHDDQDIFAALTPYCQLVAMACSVPKVMLNVMDDDTMFFIAQAALGSDGLEIGVDPVVQACSEAAPLEGRVCELVIRMTPDAKTPPIFTVQDMKDSEFRNLLVVSGPPYYRFYAGTPITTKNGINIGSLAVLDTKPRSGLSVDLERLLGRTAVQVMDLLETRRYAIEGKRAVHLLRSVEALTTGKKTINVQQQQPQQSYSLPRKKRRASTISFSTDDSEDEELSRQVSSTGPDTFERAAGLLREAFDDLDGGVEVVFAFLSASRHGPACYNEEASYIATPRFCSEQPAKIPRHIIKSLVKRYPFGCLFDLDERVCHSPVNPENTGRLSLKPSYTPVASELDRLEALQEAFPGASQVLFTSMWDSDRGSIASAVFVANMSTTYFLSLATDLTFLNSFCCSLMAECSRIDASRTTKQKEDFVGTISHEMRSPLHGILAGAEFLAETLLDPHQSSLVSTVQSCGRTLLDTINHVLDYSKITTYRKAWQVTNARTKGLKGRRAAPAPPAMLQMTDVVEVAAVVEEVVDTLLTGQEFRHDEAHTAERLQVLLDIQPGNWAFLTQPGAIRRIVMNLTGNAIKYTSEGSVAINLEQPNMDEVLLTVRDTGCGISEKFISTKLFEAFSQENALAPGTGLGLSIVHSIVTMLGGSITVSSEVGVGSVFKVVLPLQRPLPGQQSTQTTPHSGNSSSSTGSNPSAAIDAIQQLRYRFMLSISDESLRASIEKLISQWFKLPIVDDHADVCITDDADVKSSCRTVVVLGALVHQQEHSNRQIEFIPIPVGPYRLARSLCAIFMRSDPRRSFSRGSIDLSPISEQPHQESLSERMHEVNLGASIPESSYIIQATDTMAMKTYSPQAQRLMTPRNDSLVEEPESFPFPGQEASSFAAPQNGTRPRGQPRVLVVDDNRINLSLLTNFLQKKRKYATVGSAEDGQQAVDMFTTEAENKSYDIIFMDISMPIMNGFQATRAIREVEHRSAADGALIIALTGLAGSHDQAEAFEAGVDVYLTKPVSFKSVAELLTNWENSRNSPRRSVEGQAREMLGADILLVDKQHAVGALAG